MGWLKLLLKSFQLLFKGFPEGCREAMRLSYQKHYDQARTGSAPIDGDSHHLGLFGALGTRYKARGVLQNPNFPDTVLWSELTPFFLMSKYDSIQALAEYVLWQEMPSAAKKNWLARKINQALCTKPSDDEDSPSSLASLAFLNNVKWCELLYPGTRTMLSCEAQQLSAEGPIDSKR